MKKILKKDRMVIISALIVIGLILLVIIIALSIRPRSSSNYLNEGYDFVETTIEDPGSNVYTSDTIKSEHCLGNICVSDVQVYYLNNNGRFDCKITNKGSSKATGYLKLNAKYTSLVLAYRDLEPGKTANASANYYSVKFEQFDDYTLSELSDTEKIKIIDGKKK